MMRYVVVGVVAVVGFLGADYLEPRIQSALNLSPENRIGAKAVKYGLLGGLAAVTFWAVEKYAK
jgi:hypothetical protein